jgi:hypothetical protein
VGVPSDRDAALALLPGLADAHRELHRTVWDGPVPAEVLERCRLRLAQLHRSTRALQERSAHAPLGDAAVGRLSQWYEDPSLDDGARVCIAFAELFAIDPHAIGDEHAAAVVDAFGDAGLVHLTTALGLWENLHRFDNALAMLAAQPPHQSPSSEA